MPLTAVGEVNANGELAAAPPTPKVVCVAQPQQVRPVTAAANGGMYAEKQALDEGTGGAGGGGPVGRAFRCLAPFAARRRHQKVAPIETKKSIAKDLKAAFCEHTWDIYRIAANFADSNVDTKCAAKSGGLSSEKAKMLLELNGPNELPRPKEMGNLELFLRQFWNILWIMLICCSTLSMLQFLLDTASTVHLYISLIIYSMVVGMCTMSWYEEMNAKKVVMGFEKLLPKFCIAIRDGKDMFIGAQHLVVGDIIRIKNGSRIPADCRILQCNQLKLESSSITGEAEPIDHQAEEVAQTVNVFEAHNVALNGSLCVDGEGIAIVIKTGKETAIGQIADMTSSQGSKKSRLEMQIRKYVVFLLCLASTMASIIFVVGGWVRSWQSIISLVTNGFLVCIIALVPTGLPATVTSMLSLIAKRLANKKVYLKRLDICEALGQVGIIASDKTGTLTKNQMTVTCLWHHDKVINGIPERVEEVNSSSDKLDGFSAPVAEILQCMAVSIAPSNEASSPTQTAINIDQEAGEQRPISGRSMKQKADQKQTEKRDTGSPSEMAMIHYAEQYFDDASLPNVVFEVPFNSRRKWHLVIVRTSAFESDGEEGDAECEYKVLMKGASEILAKRCGKILAASGQEIPFGRDETDRFENIYKLFAADGLRVIGFATAKFRAPVNMAFSLEKENFPTENLTFLGVCGIQDPPRDESAEAIRLCHRAGIKVFMVTGDHQLTATAIAKQIGLIPSDGTGQRSDFEVIHGDQIAKLTEPEWDMILAKQGLVFARTTPEQKLFIVEQCQKRRQLIAMTGDGVNDAPALKKADIGIAMGSGSEVAKQASDIILMDDNFSSIVRAVKEGRVMYENIKKLLAYTMPHSFPQVWPVLFNFCFGMPQGITALQILSVDLGTELLPGISMIKEPPEHDVMDRPPRPMDEVLVSGPLLTYCYLFMGQSQSLGCILSYFTVFWSYGISISDLWMSELDNNWVAGGAVFISNGMVFSAEKQLYIVRQACAAWQMANVFGQFFNVWNAKTPRESLFKNFRQVFWGNKVMLVALVCELALICAYVYMPGLNRFLGGAPVPWECWLVAGAFGIIGIVYNEVRKLIIRQHPQARIVRYIKF